MMTTAADILVEQLQARGVPFIATLNGHGLNPFYIACHERGMRMIDVRNEQAASYIAEITGRLSRAVGVCAVSGAVAHANALTGVLNARFDGAPMLLITGNSPFARLGCGDFQDFNPLPMTAPICKYARMLDTPDQVARIVHEAFVAATSGRPGPVHLTLPQDVAAAEVEPELADPRVQPTGQVQLSGQAEPELLREAARLIQLAQRPLLVAGSGLYYARGEHALAEFVQQQQMPTAMPIWDRGCVGQNTDTFVGVLGAASGGARLLGDADLILIVGAELDHRVGQLTPPAVSPDAVIIRLHADQTCLYRGSEADVSLLGSPAAVLRQLTEACGALNCEPASGWLAEARQRRDAHRRQCLAIADKLPSGISGRDVVLAINQVMTDETVLLVDGGNIGQWFHQLMPDRCPGHWITCGASGVIGFGLPGAMAARALYPDRPVILLSGDGSFTFTVAELECAARQKLPFVAVVADDQLWGITRTGQIDLYGQPYYSALGPTRLDKVAAGFGCLGVYIERKEDLVPALKTALSEDRPTVIQVPIVPGSPAG